MAWDKYCRPSRPDPKTDGPGAWEHCPLVSLQVGMGRTVVPEMGPGRMGISVSVRMTANGGRG